MNEDDNTIQAEDRILSDRHLRPSRIDFSQAFESMIDLLE
jgi:hypothetical protein